MARMVFANFMMTSYKVAMHDKPGKVLVCQSNEHQGVIWCQPGGATLHRCTSFALWGLSMFPVLETPVRVVTCITAGGRKLFARYFSVCSPWPGIK